MAEAPNGSQPRLILSAQADGDRKGIYAYSFTQWGEAQAKRYSDFLMVEILSLADDPTRAPFVENLNRVRSYTARRSRARTGHRIFYREIEGGIFIIRILHTAINWLELLPEATKELNAQLLADRAKRKKK